MPTIQGDEVDINGQPRLMDVPYEPMGMNVYPPIGGMPQAPNASQEILKVMNSPEYKQKLSQLANRGQSALDEQRQGLQQNQALADIMMKQQGLSPLWGLMDQQLGTHLSATDPARNDMLLKLNNLIQGQRGQLSQDEIKFMQGQLSGPNSPLNAAKTLSQMDYYNRYNPGGGAYNLAQQQRDFHEHQGVLGSIDKDKTNTQRLANSSNIANSLNNFINADISSPAQLEELQQTIRGSLGIKGPGGVNEREATYLKSLDADIQKAKQYWKGPQDLKDPTKGPVIQATIDHLTNLAKMEQGNFANQAQQRMQTLKAGHESLYERNPRLEQDLNNKIKMAGEQYSPQNVGGPEVGTVEDGHRFKGGDPSDQNNWEEVK